MTSNLQNDVAGNVHIHLTYFGYLPFDVVWKRPVVLICNHSLHKEESQGNRMNMTTEMGQGCNHSLHKEESQGNRMNMTTEMGQGCSHSLHKEESQGNRMKSVTS